MLCSIIFISVTSHVLVAKLGLALVKGDQLHHDNLLLELKDV